MGRKKNLIPFYTIVDDVNSQEFVKYDVMPYLVRSYDDKKKDERPKTFDEFKKFIENASRYMYWARCEYEVILKPWVSHTKERKIDVHWQLMNNLDVVTSLLMLNLGIKEEN